MSFTGDYSEIADAQLDALETGGDATLYDAVLDAIELIFRVPGQAQALSTAITTAEGIPCVCPLPVIHRTKSFGVPMGRELKRFSRIPSCLPVGAG